MLPAPKAVLPFPLAAALLAPMTVLFSPSALALNPKAIEYCSVVADCEPIAILPIPTAWGPSAPSLEPMATLYLSDAAAFAPTARLCVSAAFELYPNAIALSFIAFALSPRAILSLPDAVVPPLPIAMLWVPDDCTSSPIAMLSFHPARYGRMFFPILYFAASYRYAVF